MILVASLPLVALAAAAHAQEPKPARVIRPLPGAQPVAQPESEGQVDPGKLAGIQALPGISLNVGTPGLGDTSPMACMWAGWNPVPEYCQD